VYWQIGGEVTLQVDSTSVGIFLGLNGINLQTRASVRGRLFAQKAVTLDQVYVAYSSLLGNLTRLKDTAAATGR
jgi:hypothetical protein